MTWLSGNKYWYFRYKRSPLPPWFWFQWLACRNKYTMLTKVAWALLRTLSHKRYRTATTAHHELWPSCIAVTTVFLSLQHYMEVNDQRHTQAILPPRKQHPVPFAQVVIWSNSNEKSLPRPGIKPWLSSQQALSLVIALTEPLSSYLCQSHNGDMFGTCKTLHNTRCEHVTCLL